jgi:predicted nuclease of predicted toxin-antitoxin system
VRFLCDQQVDARVAVALRRLGHDAWTVANAGRSRAEDDELTVYADDRDAVLISHDVEFSERRRRNVVGRHIFLRCNEWDAAELIERHLDDLLPMLSRYSDVWVKLSGLERPELSFRWE